MVVKLYFWGYMNMNNNRLHIIFFTTCRSLLGVHHLIVFEMNWTVSRVHSAFKFPLFPSLFRLRHLAFGAPMSRHPDLFHLFLEPARCRHSIYKTKKRDGGDSNRRPLGRQASVKTTRPRRPPQFQYIIGESFQQEYICQMKINLCACLQFIITKIAII